MALRQRVSPARRGAHDCERLVPHGHLKALEARSRPGVRGVGVHLAVKRVGDDHARFGVQRAGAAAAVQVVGTLVRAGACAHGGGEDVHLVCVGIGGHANGVDEVGVDLVHLRVLLEHFLHQRAASAKLPVQRKRRFVAFVAELVVADAFALIRRLDHDLAVPGGEGQKRLCRAVGRVEPFPLEKFPEQAVKQHLVARNRQRPEDVANARGKRVLPLDGKVFVALGVGLVVKGEVKKLVHIAQRHLARPGKLLPRDVRAERLVVPFKLFLFFPVAHVLPVFLRRLVNRAAHGLFERCHRVSPLPACHSLSLSRLS